MWKIFVGNTKWREKGRKGERERETERQRQRGKAFSRNQ